MRKNHFERILLSLIILVFSSNQTFAGITNFINQINGSSISISASMDVEDDQFNYMVANPSSWPNEFTNINKLNKVTLKYTGTQKIYYSSAWSISVDFTLKKWDASGAPILPDETGTLSINFDPAPGITYTDISTYLSSAPGFKTTVIINNIVHSGIGPVLPSDVIIESEIETERYYFLDVTQVTTIGAVYTSNSNTTEFQWNYLSGAEEYELEWLYISLYTMPGGNYTSFLSNASNYDFKNASRITTPFNYYTINNVYDEGVILYRVRGVGRFFPPDFPSKRYGAWTQNIISGAPVNYVYNNAFEPTKDWKYGISYAEDGKAKELLSFYDGTLRERQSLTKLNTADAVLVSEKIYDTEGREAIQTLPAPAFNTSLPPNKLAFYSQYSLNSAGALYTRSNFDNDALLNASCVYSGPDPMKEDLGTGASGYYSPFNALVNEGYNAVIPDAFKYPFSQVRYGADQKIKSQSGFGPDFKSGSGHETEYFYCTPLQSKLNRLFGAEVGDASHYKQNAVRDPNGQLTVSYVNLKGQVIATSLVGQSPASLQQLNEPNTAVVNSTDQLLTPANNQYVSTEEAIIMSYPFFVSNPGSTYTFNYNLTPETYNDLCSGVHDCEYDVRITILDNACGNNVIYDNTYTLDATNLSISAIVLPPGTFPRIDVYTVKKKLTLNQAAVQAALNAFLASLPCQFTPGDFNSVFTGNIDWEDCNKTCQEYCEYYATNTLSLTPHSTAWDAAVQTCMDQNCPPGSAATAHACDVMLHYMEQDMSPGGQYFDNRVFSSSSTSYDNDWLNYHIPQSAIWFLNAWPPNNWFPPLSPNSAWFNSTFIHPSVTIDDWDEVRQYWQPQWTSIMVQFHPEYCHYNWCLSMQTSRAFDLNLYDTHHNTLLWATNNPTTALPYIDLPSYPVVGTNMLQYDQYFSSGPGVSQAGTMLGKIQLYTTNPTNRTMWEEACARALTINPSGCTGNCDEQWQQFLLLYMSEKGQLEHAMEQSTCPFLNDNNNPPDNICDDANPHPQLNLTGFYIRVPDYYPQINALTASQATAVNWGNSLGDYNVCNQPALATFQYDCNWGGTIFSGCAITASSTTLGFSNLQISGPINPNPGSNTACVDVLTAIVSAINSYISSPYDFTAQIDPQNPTTRFMIYAPPSLGANGNTISIFLNGNCLSLPTNFCIYQVPNCSTCSCPTCPTTTNPCPPVPSSGYAMSDGCSNCCPPDFDCLCARFAQLAAFYNTLDPNNPPNYYVDHTAYLTAEDYIAFRFNTAFSLSPQILASDVSLWEAQCANPLLGAPAVPDGMNCNLPEPCENEPMALATFWGDESWNNYVNDLTEQFLREYKKKCFETVESFDVNYDDAEYHYTLYYYDQAGNLTRTVPPQGVDIVTQNHSFVTNYKYNTLDKVTEQSTPDAGTTKFYYNSAGMLRFSQSARQYYIALNPPPGGLPVGWGGPYSYTKYDEQGRIIEVGESMDVYGITNFANGVDDVTFPINGSEVTSTYYDSYNSVLNPALATMFDGGPQQNLRSRVVSVTYEDVKDFTTPGVPDISTYNSATHYSYDIHGNVNELIQENVALSSFNQQYKDIKYKYDLVSGNVNEVHYQSGHLDQFHHRYTYDADNRITQAFTSRDGMIWDKDAKYFYNLHGPLARTEIGDEKVQGLDFAYTINGWLKGVNATVLVPLNDMGKDGITNNYMPAQPDIHLNVAQDAFGFALSYYDDPQNLLYDYRAINFAQNSSQGFLADIYNVASVPNSNLFNGNIKQMAVALSQPNVSALPSAMQLMAYQYKYDQLNRIILSSTVKGVSTSAYFGNVGIADYLNTFTYDANGNITTQIRNGIASVQQTMDNLHYFYWTSAPTVAYDPLVNIPANATNKLAFVDDAVINSPYNDDIESGQAGPPLANYEYDASGNLIQDKQEQIDNAQGGSIEWTVYGKVKKVTRNTLIPVVGNPPDLEFAYDPSGNRIMKLEKPRVGGVLTPQTDWIYTYYVNDAGGKIVATYKRTTLNNVPCGSYTEISLTEHEIYGSGRIGVDAKPVTLVSCQLSPGNTGMYERTLGQKQYELTNHLGNVLEVVSDKKLTYSSIGVNVDYYTADVLSTTDYSPFGAILPGRSFNASSYKFGFNGAEKDNEIKGTGNSYTTEFRQYDPRLGRWLSPDPAMNDFADYSPYVNNFNNPIAHTDPGGDCPDGNCGDEEIVAANAIVSKHYDPKHNRKDISAELHQEVLALAQTDQGKGMFKTAADIETFMELVQSTWEETFFADFLGKGNAYREAINSAEGTEEKADIIQLRSLHMRAEMVKFSLVAEGLTDWFIGMVASSNPATSIRPYSGRSFQIIRQVLHKNSNSYTGHQGVYQILIDGKLYKYGKADMTKLASSGNPTRLQSQLNRLQKLFPNSVVEGKVVYQNAKISTKAIKAVETSYVQQYYNIHKAFPPGNMNHPGVIK